MTAQRVAELVRRMYPKARSVLVFLKPPCQVTVIQRGRRDLVGNGETIFDCVAAVAAYGKAPKSVVAEVARELKAEVSA